jgi:hypothetical protein
MKRWFLETEEQRKHFLTHVMEEVANGRKPCVEFVEPTLSPAQFNSKWLWCEQVAAFLNDCGLDMREVLRDDMPIPWTKASVDERLYKPVLKAMTGKEHTGDQNKLEPSVVVEVITRHIAESKGVTLPPFPSRGV